VSGIDSGDPAERKQTTRTPWGPSSAASCLDKLSSAAQAVPTPPTSGQPMRDGVAVIIIITPDPFLIMCGATAFAVRNCVLVAFAIGRVNSSSDISVSGVP